MWPAYARCAPGRRAGHTAPGLPFNRHLSVIIPAFMLIILIPGDRGNISRYLYKHVFTGQPVSTRWNIHLSLLGYVSQVHFMGHVLGGNAIPGTREGEGWGVRARRVPNIQVGLTTALIDELIPGRHLYRPGKLEHLFHLFRRDKMTRRMANITGQNMSSLLL